MIRNLIFAAFAFAAALAIYLFFYLGFYKPVEIAVEKRGPLYLIFKSHTGAYHEINATISEVEKWAHDHAVTCAKTFGEYLDDPEKMDQDRLRSRGGCILNGTLMSPPPEFQYDERGEKKYVVAKFTGSPAIGPIKVYSKVKRYLAENRLQAEGAVIEIYDIQGQNVTTEYLFLLK